jgi:hypothetical protein
VLTAHDDKKFLILRDFLQREIPAGPFAEFADKGLDGCRIDERGPEGEGLKSPSIDGGEKRSGENDEDFAGGRQ